MRMMACSPASKTSRSADFSDVLKMTKPLSSFSAFSFLVDEDDAEALERHEKRGARADGDVDLAAPRAPPLVEALARGEAAVEDGDALAETLLEPRREDGGERDLRDEEQRLLAAP